MGNPDYEVTGGSVTLDGEELLGLPTHERAVRGLFLAMQYPVEVPGVGLDTMLRAALEARGIEPNGLTADLVREAELVGLAPSALGRPVNVAFSGGEKKRNETVQLAVLRPRIAVIDEIDSGLDIDALREVARRIEQMTRPRADLGVPGHHPLRTSAHRAATRPGARDARRPHRRSGGPELADQLEAQGYEGIAANL